jgi:hypothetical protein
MKRRSLLAVGLVLTALVTVVWAANYRIDKAAVWQIFELKAGSTFINRDGNDIAAQLDVLDTIDATDLTKLDGITNGTIAASKAVVVDSNKDASTFRNLGVVNLDAGSSGAAGTVDVFPVTASRGKLAISCTDQTGDTTVSLVAGAMGQATQVNLSDPGVAASYFVQTTAALTLAEADVLKSVTPGTVAVSKAVVVDGSKDISAFRNLGAVNIDAGSSGAAGSVDVFPGTASRGKLAITCTDQTGNTTVSLVVAAMGQATQVNVPDPGAAASYLVQSTTALTLAEADVLKSVTPGTVSASKALVVDGSKDLNGIRNLTCTGTIATPGYTYTAGAATPAVGLRFGATVTEGLEIKVYDETINLTNAASTTTTLAVPSGAVILSAQANLQQEVVGDGTGDNLLAKVGLGVAANEDKYGVTSALTKNLKVDTIPDWAVSGGETLIIYGLKADGTTPCTEAFVADDPMGTRAQVRVRVVYAVTNSLDDAP